MNIDGWFFHFQERSEPWLLHLVEYSYSLLQPIRVEGVLVKKRQVGDKYLSHVLVRGCVMCTRSMKGSVRCQMPYCCLVAAKVDRGVTRIGDWPAMSFGWASGCYFMITVEAVMDGEKCLTCRVREK